MNIVELQVWRSANALRLLRQWRELEEESLLLQKAADDPNTPASIRKEVVSDQRALLEAKGVLCRQAALFNQRASISLLMV